VNGATREI